MERNNGSLFRRLIAAAVSAGMLMSLAACTKAPAETTAPPRLVIEEPATSAPPPQPTTQPTELTPIQPVETTEPRIEIDYDNLVTDAYRYAFRDDYGNEFCYHIPEVNLESCASVNDEMYRTLTELMDRYVHEPIVEYGEPHIGDLLYIWSHKDDTVSILVVSNDAYVEWTDYFFYYLSAETGARLDKAGLLAAFGLSEQDFHDQVYAALKAAWDEDLKSEAYQTNDYLKEVAGELIAQTLADENIHAAIPFIDSDGRLAFVATMFVPAGGGAYQCMYDYETGEQLYYYSCDEDHSADITVSADNPLQYFIENCDRKYFTQSDIQDFDEEMCLYARNAIYAKSGWIFSSASLRSYFDRYSWYQPSVTADEFSEDMLNKYQIANRDLIVSHENAITAGDSDALQTFIENCDSRYFSVSEISSLDAEELVYARNAIYAKSGRIFTMQKLASYFQKYSWYTPRYTAEEFSEDMLNKYQVANRDLIVAQENGTAGSSSAVLSAAEAYAIACEYWDYQEGDIAEETGFELYLIEDGTTDLGSTMYYCYRLRWRVTDENGDSWLSTVDQLYINAETGECSYTIYS